MTLRVDEKFELVEVRAARVGFERAVGVNER